MGSSRILLWDNEADHRELLRYNLRKAGYQVRVVANESDLLQKATDRPPHLVILGNSSSEESRAKLCRALLEMPVLAHTHFLCLSPDESCESRSYHEGLDMHCMVMPAKPREIMREVKRILNLRSRQHGFNRICCSPFPVTA